jgi:ankyrin repeat protein
MSVEVLIILAGIAVLFVVFWSKSSGSGSSDSTAISSKPAFVPPPEKTDEELIADYQSLMRELPAAFLGGEPKPSKSDMSKLQRLSRLSALPIILPIIDQAAVLELLDAGLAAVEPVYGPADKTGKSRLQAYTKAIRKLRPAGAPASPVETKKTPSASASSSEKGRVKKVGLAAPRTGRFGFPFDVDAFAASFPRGWRLLDDLDENNVFMHGPNGAIVEGGPHQMAPSSNLYDAFETMADHFDASEEIEEFVTSINSKGWSVSGEWNDASVFAVELYGPALMSARFVYHDTTLDQGVVNAIKKSASELIWLHASTDRGPDIRPKNLKELRRLISDTVKRDKELRDEILGSYEDDENLYVSLRELEAIAILGPQAYPTVRAMIGYALSRAEIDVEDLTTLRNWCEPHFLNDPNLKEEIASKAVSAASTTRDFLSLAEAAAEAGNTDQAAECVQSAFNALASTDDYLHFMAHEMISLNDKSAMALFNKAIAAAGDPDDLRAIVDSERATKELIAPIIKRMRKSAKDADFFNGGFNPLDVLSLAVEKEFIDLDVAETELFALINASPILSDKSVGKAAQPDDVYDAFGSGAAHMHLLSMAGSVYGDDWNPVREALLARAEMAATSAAQKYAVYQFLVNRIHDDKRSKAYLKANKKVLEPFLQRKAATEQREELMDAISQCALLAAIGDGSISEEESEEVEKIRGIVDMMYRNREAINILELTQDIAKAREARESTDLHYNMSLSLFGPPAHLRDVYDDLSEVSSQKDLDGLFRKYSATIKDPFGKRLAAWAAHEVAAIDGLDNGEKHALSVMCGVWGLNFEENQRYFRDFVYPVTSDDIEFTGRTEGSGLDWARSFDAELAEHGDDSAKSLAEQLGVDSIEALMRLLGVKEEEEAVEDTEDLPPIFEALLHRADWDEVLALIDGGADVNETINLNGIKGISILTLACEHGTVEVAKALVKAGADVNRLIGNPKRASGYNSPLTASLKNGGRMDIFAYLLEAGANPDPFGDRESGWTPLTIAAQNSNHKAVKMLIERGVDVNIATSAGANAFKLMASVETGNARKCLDLLVKSGIDTSRTDDEGFAGIHNAVCECSVKHIRYLIETAKVPVDLPMKVVPGTNFFTPLQKALSFGNKPVVEYLLNAGSDPTIRLKGRSVFSAIALGALEGDVAEPIEELDRFLALGLCPNLEDVICILEFMSNADDDESQIGHFLEKLVASSTLDFASLGEADPEEIRESISNAMDEAPELTELYLGSLTKQGVDLEAWASSSIEAE